MSSSIRDLLLEALEDLDSQQFKAFTWKLTDSELDLRIPRGVVEGRDLVDIVNLLIESFTENRALEITLVSLGFDGRWLDHYFIKEKESRIETDYQLELLFKCI
uniref:Pyrin domain-containing protein n=1 Tax=Astyanax mexicanus TaxID=7994 RepID=A0A8B9GW75_ASTMX